MHGDKTKASLLRDLHADGVLVLPNAWDAGSAALIARAGAMAVATSSGGVSWAAGPTGKDCPGTRWSSGCA